MTAGEAQRLLAARNAASAPVVDDDGRILGIVSWSDLLRHALQRTSAREAGLVYSDDEEYADIAALPVDRSSTLVEKLMSSDFYTVNRDDGVSVAANVMRERQVHTVFVTERGRLVGVVTALDLMRVVEEAI